MAPEPEDGGGRDLRLEKGTGNPGGKDLPPVRRDDPRAAAAVYGRHGAVTDALGHASRQAPGAGRRGLPGLDRAAAAG